jgi:hypothetical protein
MCGKARLSPTARGMSHIAERIGRLEEYERWARCERLEIEELVDRAELGKYYELQEEILDKMRKAQEIADSLRRQVLEGSGGA